jgi:hypothetical protein
MNIKNSQAYLYLYEDIVIYLFIPHINISAEAFTHM